MRPEGADECAGAAAGGVFIVLACCVPLVLLNAFALHLAVLFAAGAVGCALLAGRLWR